MPSREHLTCSRAARTRSRKRAPEIPTPPTNFWRYEEWWPGSESNQRHADFQSAALPTELPGHGYKSPSNEGRVLDRPSPWQSSKQALKPLIYGVLTPFRADHEYRS